MRARVAGILVVGVTALGLGACGGDDDSDTTAPAGPAATEETTATDSAANEEYVREVSEALQPTITASEELQTEAGNISSPDDLAPLLTTAQESYEESAQELEAIEAPADVADLHARLVGEQEEIADATGEASDAAKRGDQAGVQAFQEAGQQYQEELNRLVEEYNAKGYDVG